MRCVIHSAASFTFRGSGALRSGRRAVTLLELMLVLSLLVLLAFFIVPNLNDPLKQTSLPESADRFRSLIYMTRAYAMLDGMRYRIRFLSEDAGKAKELSGQELNQPIVEVEKDPVQYPGAYESVKASWASGETFLGNVWCYRILPGEPTYDSALVEPKEKDSFQNEDDKKRKREEGLKEDEDWMLFFGPDGTSAWMSFRLVDAPKQAFDERKLAEYEQVDVIVDGRLGLVFLQRPLYQDEIDVLAEKGHSPLLRRDFMAARHLTEDDVLEIDMTK